MGTKGPKAGNIYSSLKSRGLIGGKGKDPMLNVGSPFKQTKDGSDGSLYGKARAAVVGGFEAAGGVKGMAKHMAKSMQTQLTSLGQGNRHMDGSARQQPQEPSKPDLSSKAKTSQPSKSKDADTPYTPAKFNAGLKKASADGKLDNNEEFKKLVDGSSVAKYGKPTPAKKKNCYK